MHDIARGYSEDSDPESVGPSDTLPPKAGLRENNFSDIHVNVLTKLTSQAG